MPAGGAAVERFAGTIAARAEPIAGHAREDGDDGPEPAPGPATGDSGGRA